MEFSDLLHLPAENLDRELEQGLVEMVGRIRRMDKEKRKLVLSVIKGMLEGVEKN